MATTDGAVWAGALIAAVAAVPLWKITVHVITVAHEGGHAFFAGLVGSGVQKVTMQPNGNGETVTKGGGWFTTIFVGLFGYLGPSLWGLIGGWMLVHGVTPKAVLMTSLVMLGVLLLSIRNFFGFLLVPAIGYGVWATVTHGSAEVQKTVAYALMWFMLIGGVRSIPRLFQVVRAVGMKEPDTANLKRATWLPQLFFVALFLFGTVVALVYGGKMLLHA
jgi:hypothetical protein